MTYYSRDNCVSAGDQSGCSTDYDVSDIKQVVDIWKSNYASGATEARLATVDELSALGYEYQENVTSVSYEKISNTPSWVYAPNNEYWYWTMSEYTDHSNFMWMVNEYGSIGSYCVVDGISGVVFVQS